MSGEKNVQNLTRWNIFIQGHGQQSPITCTNIKIHKVITPQFYFSLGFLYKVINPYPPNVEKMVS